MSLDTGDVAAYWVSHDYRYTDTKHSGFMGKHRWLSVTKPYTMHIKCWVMKGIFKKDFLGETVT